MQSIIIILACLAMLLAGLLGITLSVPLQAPAVILLGLAAILAAIQVLKPRSAGVWESKVKSQKVQNPSTLDNGRKSWLLGLSLGSIFYFVGRAWFSPVRDLGVEDLMLILPASILYLVAGYGMRGKSGVHLRMGLAITVIVLLLLHIGSCLLQITGGEGYSLTPLFTGAVRSSEGHVTGMYGYYGSFANFAVIAGLLSLSLGMWGRMSLVSRGILFLLGVVTLVLAVYSQSRSAIISLIPALLVFFVLLLVSVRCLNPLMRKRIKLTVTSLSILALLVGTVAGFFVFQNRSNPKDEKVDTLELAFDSRVRMPYWSMAGEQWIDHPMNGAGARSFSYLSYIYWSPNLGTHAGNPEFVHNEYLQLLADYGLLGLILIIALLVWHFSLGFKQVRLLADKIAKDGFLQGSNAMALAIAGLCGMTAMAVHICFDFRTHLLANLLLLVCCAVWVLPVPRLRKDDRRKTADDRQGKIGGESYASEGFQPWGLALVLLALGLGSVGLGGLQLWAGAPLLQNQMAKEDGAWVPQDVDREVWIPALEESLERAPQWRRYQRLGTLYRLEAKDAVDPQKRSQNLLKSEQAYLNSIERHPYNPIPRINLASIYAELERWIEADAIYQSTVSMATAREPWFRMHQQWGEMHRRWASLLWREGRIDEASKHYIRSQELYWRSKEIAVPHNERWRNAYMNASFEFVYFLLSEKNYDNALVLITRCEKEGGRSRVLRLKADYLLNYGEFLWLDRKPELALRYMYEARNQYLSCKKWSKNNVDERWHANFKKTEEIIKFLKAAGVKRSADY